MKNPIEGIPKMPEPKITQTEIDEKAKSYIGRAKLFPAEQSPENPIDVSRESFLRDMCSDLESSADEPDPKNIDFVSFPNFISEDYRKLITAIKEAAAKEGIEIKGDTSKEEVPRPKLEEVYRILHTNAAMICDKMGESLSFYSLYEEERQAEIAEQRLKELGLSPRREGQKLFLKTQFSKEEIEAAKNYTTLIK